MGAANLKSKALSTVNNMRFYWKEPPKGKFMSYKEIFAYAFGGIGAAFVIQLGSTMIVSSTNMIVGGAIGVAPTDMYILYLISTIINIPLTALRANMVDSTRSKAGKYRPYLLSMGIPTALIASGYVWFPYEKLGLLFPGEIFGRPGKYVALCAVVLIFNLLLHFFFNFFNDAYTNLIHVLSPNTQERTDALAVKSIVYSLAPSIMNMVLPMVAKYVSNDNLYDIKVYRISYPIFAIVGILLTIVVFANTQEKIVQAKTHTMRISFIDAFREVAKNKYFWIVAFAGWLGFLENSYYNILSWSYSYGHSCSAETMMLINTLVGNAAFWGMLFAPFCIRRMGKKRVLLSANFLNIVCILMMLLNMQNVWWLFICVYFNSMILAFEQITTPAIQADIRDYQQYRTGERIDGMFATVSTIGNLVTLVTSSVLPAVEERFGIYEGNGFEQPFDILDVTTGEPGLLYKMLGALILMAGLGAFLNMVPYFFYDFTEKKQKSVIRVLQVRSLFEDYGNNALNNHQIVEAIDMVNSARQAALLEPKEVDKNAYKSVRDKAERKIAKAQYKADLEYNEEIEISKFVCDELDKFNSDLFKHQVAVYGKIFALGLEYVRTIDFDEAKKALKAARKLPKATEAEKQRRTFEIEFAKKNITARNAYVKYFSAEGSFVEPDMNKLTELFKKEDKLDSEIFALVEEREIFRKKGEKQTTKEITLKIKALQKEKKAVQNGQKLMMDEYARFNRAARPYIDAKKLLTQQENYSHFDEIAALYDEAKIKAEAEDREKEEALKLKIAEQEAEEAERKAKANK